MDDYYEKPAEPKMSDLAFKIEELIDKHKWLAHTLGEVLATMTLAANQNRMVSELNGIATFWKANYERYK